MSGTDKVFVPIDQNDDDRADEVKDGITGLNLYPGKSSGIRLLIVKRQANPCAEDDLESDANTVRACPVVQQLWSTIKMSYR